MGRAALWRAWGVAAAVMAMGASSARAEVVGVQILSREPFEGGKVYTGAGAYEVVRGRATFALDPDSPANQRIVDLDKAPRDPSGRVVFSTDFNVLRPVKPTGSTLIYEVNNRGGDIAGVLNSVPDPTGRQGRIDGGFLQRHGYSVLSSAWAWDVKAQPGLMTFKPPVATDHGRPITGTVANEFTVDKASRTASFVGIDGRAYPMAVADDPAAVLTWRARPHDRRVVIPRAAWRLAPSADGNPPSEIESSGGFKPGLIYELTYTAKDPYVVGAGMAGIRDLLSWFRTHTFEGVPPPPQVLAFGFSQTGRLIEQMVYDGFDVGEDGKLAFDGALSVVGGAGRGSFNYRFGFPTRAASLIEDTDYPTDLFPFTTRTETDAVTGRVGSVLDRARDRDGAAPKLFLVDKSTEFWGRAASLLETDPGGTADVGPAATTRLYLLAGMQHFPGWSGDRADTVNCVNPEDDSPTLRAMIVDLDAWVRGAASPPPSAFPTIASGTLITDAAYRRAFPAGLGLTPPTEPYIPQHLDFGPRFASEGVAGRMPPGPGAPYGVRVPKPDGDGIDLGGWRAVEIEVPLGAYTGWNGRAPATGFAWGFDRFQGSFKPFARTEAEGKADGDPRPSLQTRYGSRQAFLDATRRAAERAVAEHRLLAEDVDETVAGQGGFWDRIMAHDPHDPSCAYLDSPVAAP